MLRYNVTLNSKSDVELCLSELSSRAIKAGVGTNELPDLLAQSRQIIEKLLETGQIMESQGSQLVVDRILEGRSYQIKIEAKFGQALAKTSRFKALFGKK